MNTPILRHSGNNKLQNNGIVKLCIIVGHNEQLWTRFQQQDPDVEEYFGILSPNSPYQYSTTVFIHCFSPPTRLQLLLPITLTQIYSTEQKPRLHSHGPGQSRCKNKRHPSLSLYAHCFILGFQSFQFSIIKLL